MSLEGCSSAPEASLLWDDVVCDLAIGSDGYVHLSYYSVWGSMPVNQVFSQPPDGGAG